uniref:Fibronectin type-III domain-containing protein n=1 Tax=Lates calcarifer TaxID=8187 RepID=A0A4W6BVD3_LATCA
MSCNHCVFCVPVWQPPRPNISPLQAISDKQSLVVSWLVNHSGLAGNIYEIQISRTENHIIIYSANVSVPSTDTHQYTWTWTSDLPLECVNHSVRIRHFYNQSFLSPWSEWATNNGAEAKDKTKLFPFQQVLREGTSGVFCCVPPVGVNITNITLSKKKYPIISIGTRVKAIVVPNLTIPKNPRKALLLTCSDTSGKGDSYIWNYVSHKSIPYSYSHFKDSLTTLKSQRNYDFSHLCCGKHRNSDQAPVTCGPSSCTFQAIPDLEEYNISVVVKDQLGEETASYSFNISERVSPVTEWGGVSPGMTDTTVSWIVQGNLTQMNLLCQVAVDPGSTTELNCKSVSDPCKVKLQHLLPSTRYSTRVRCSVNGRFWGKWTKPIPFTTYPFVTLDLWRRIKQMSDPYSRQVTLLWKLDDLGSATIQGFTVQGSQEGQNRTELIPALDSEQTQAEVPIGPGQYDFTVEAILRNGPSIPAHITIPKLDDTKKQLNSSSAGGFNLSWAEEDTATCGFTVEWCVLGNAVPCTLQWIHLPEGNNTLFLAAGKCLFYSVQSPSLVEPVQITSSTVTLEWHYNEADPSHPAFITGYLVIVQEFGGHTARMFNVSDPQKKSVTIEGLKQSHKYVFSVSALTKKGPGEPAKIRITTKANCELYNIQYTRGLSFYLIFFVCLFVFSSRLRRGLKKVFAYPAGMDIRTSELHSFLQEVWIYHSHNQNMHRENSYNFFIIRCI